MAGWRANLSLLSLDPSLARGVDAEIKRLTEQAARVWLDAALAIVPTWSRASRATFESLAQAVGYNITYGPVTAFTDRRPLGLSTGFGGIERRASGSYAFFYRTDLRYLVFNESNRATVGVAGVFKGLINPTPYNFRKAGEEAFAKFVEGRLGRVLDKVRITSQRI